MGIFSGIINRCRRRRAAVEVASADVDSDRDGGGSECEGEESGIYNGLLSTSTNSLVYAAYAGGRSESADACHELAKRYPAFAPLLTGGRWDLTGCSPDCKSIAVNFATGQITTDGYSRKIDIDDGLSGAGQIVIWGKTQGGNRLLLCRFYGRTNVTIDGIADVVYAAAVTADGWKCSVQYIVTRAGRCAQ